MLQSASGHWRYNFQTEKNGDGRVDLDLITPLDKTIAEKSNLQARACFKDFFAAAEITLDQPVSFSILCNKPNFDLLNLETIQNLERTQSSFWLSFKEFGPSLC